MIPEIAIGTLIFMIGITTYLIVKDVKAPVVFVPALQVLNILGFMIPAFILVSYYMCGPTLKC